jgi:hypothetical protein
MGLVHQSRQTSAISLLSMPARQQRTLTAHVIGRAGKRAMRLAKIPATADVLFAGDFQPAIIPACDYLSCDNLRGKVHRSGPTEV